LSTPQILDENTFCHNAYQVAANFIREAGQEKLNKSNLVRSAMQAYFDTTLSLDTVVILGSGLSQIPLGLLENALAHVVIPYNAIPGFQSAGVAGHSGQLSLVRLPHKWVAFLEGRFHYYEGYSMAQVVFPVRVLRLLGASSLLVTNAAGGINPAFQPGTLMLISDHLNLMGDNPLRGKNDVAFGDRFPDMSDAYTLVLREQAKTLAKQHNIVLEEGIYAGVAGPNYETPAEIRMLKILGADAVGMSTIPEVIAANHMTMQVLGISCITNSAAGVKAGKLSHDEVLETAGKASQTLGLLISHLLGVQQDAVNGSAFT
jgi:purine-nucleoside phosphorylase